MINRKQTLLYRTNSEKLTPTPEVLGDGELAINTNKKSPMLLFKNNNNEIEKVGAMLSSTGDSESHTMTQKVITKSLNNCAKIIYFDEYKNVEQIEAQINLDINSVCYDTNTNTFVFKSVDGKYYNQTSIDKMSQYININTLKPYPNKIYILSSTNQMYVYNNNSLKSTTLVIEQTKQNKLLSGENICTINGKSLIESQNGSWNIQIEGGGTTPIVDDLNSELVSSALSANQGRILNTNKLDSSIYEKDKVTFALKEDLINFPIINETSKNISILPNHYYLWGVVSTLTITLEPPTNLDIKNEYIIQFSSGTNATSLHLPDTIKWVNNKFMKINPNKTYVITIVNNLAVGGEF